MKIMLSENIKYVTLFIKPCIVLGSQECSRGREETGGEGKKGQ